MKKSKKRRINITIDPLLHDWATAHAPTIGTDFSGYVAQLIVADRDQAKKDRRILSFSESNHSSRPAKGKKARGKGGE